MPNFAGRFVLSDVGIDPITLPPVPLKGDQGQRRFNEAIRDNLLKMSNGPNPVARYTDVKRIIAATPGPDDLRVPPAPVGLTADGAFRNIILIWDFPDYDYHAYTRVFRANVDDFNQATVIGSTEGKIWSDNVGSGTGFYYWVANVSKGGIQSAPNGVAGTYAETAPDVDFLLETLEGQVLESTLHTDLASRIDLIDASAAVPGSVAARIKTETDARTSADGAITTRIDTLQAGYDGDIASIQTTQSAHADAIDGLGAEYTVKVDVNGRVAGIGIAADTTASQIEMLADKFAIVIPGVEGGAPKVPFVATTIGGVARVGITSAFIGDAAITRAKIQDLAVDNAKIAGGITADKLSVTSLSAVSANIGLLRTASTGARTEIQDNQIRVYDSAGTLRVRMGVW